jgi:methyl-accepting chemotaxis protein
MRRRPLSALSLRTKLAVGFGATGALLVLALVVSLLALDRQQSATQTLAHRNALQVQAADDVSKGASDLAGWESANVLSGGGNASDLDASIAEFRGALAALKGRVANPEQEALATKIDTQFTAFLALDRLIRSSRREGALDRARELALGPVLLDYGNISEDSGTFAEVARLSQAEQVKAATRIAANARWILIALSSLAILLCALVATAVSRSILGRTRDLLEAAEAVAGGDLTRTVEPSADELGRLASAFNTMVSSLAALVREIEFVSDSLVGTSAQMASGSSEAHRAVAEISRAIESMAVGTERQVVLVADARTRAGDVVSKARASSDSASSTTDDAATARRLAAEGVEAAEDAHAAMQSLAESSSRLTDAMGEFTERSERIGGIVETITGIAGQTNLLALNAAIEAARAGEQGRGFAVVAEQVRKLADEAQAAAGSISGLIVEMQAETHQIVEVVQESARRTDGGAATVDAARARFLEIDEAVSRVADSAGTIAAAGSAIAEQVTGMERQLDELSGASESASSSAEQISASTQETAAGTDEIASAARGLSETAESLRALIARFRVARAPGADSHAELTP